MPLPFGARTTSGQVNTMLDRTPDKCPLCHFAITPIELGMGVQCIVNGTLCVDRALWCPNVKCERMFIARYTHRKQVGLTAGQPEQFALYSCMPRELTSQAQSETISAISPDFCQIYEQASKAEQYELVLVAGPGYRKALEFLIKDYVVSQFAEEDVGKKAAQQADVEKMQLGPCIAKYVKNEQVKEISKRAVWLGNDETHYVRKWEGKDLEDLKRLISLTLHWIEMDKLTADAIKEMPHGKT
jgi:hypothetical protein